MEPVPPIHSASTTASIPCHVLAVVFGATCIVIGALWDISWHSTVGRDTFWTAAHMVIYLGGVLGGCGGGWVALRSTFGGNAALRAASISVWGGRAPLGAWVAIWGAIAMIASAGFDDWWHNAYGLDVEILSPPHALLAAGMFAIALGGLLLILGVQNRLEGAARRRAGFLLAYACGIALAMATIFLTEKSLPNQQHGAEFYFISCMTYPFYLLVAARTSVIRWPATVAALSCMGLILIMAWILPLFSAQPLLGPIYNPVDRMVPPAFPPILVAPAIAIDLLGRSSGREERPQGTLRDWILTPILAAAFLGIFLAVQWNFSAFLLTPAGDNWFFLGTRFFTYFNHIGDWWKKFWLEPATALDLGRSFLLALLVTRLGLWCGNWLSRVKR